jgi:hypothetical protein
MKGVGQTIGLCGLPADLFAITAGDGQFYKTLHDVIAYVENNPAKAVPRSDGRGRAIDGR